MIILLMEVSPFGLRKVGRAEVWIFPRRVSELHTRPNDQIPPRQGDNKAGSSNPREGVPREQVWLDYVEAPA